MADNSMMTMDQLSKTLKQRFPQLDQYPDSDLVKKVLERRPELKSRLVGAPPPGPTPPKELTAPDPMIDRVQQRMGDNVKSLMEMFPRVIESTSTGVKENIKKRGLLPAIAGAPGEYGKAWGTEGKNLIKGMWSITAPGIAQRMVSGEDPANIIGDAVTTALAPGEDIARSGEPAIKAGSIRNAKTRASAAYNDLASKYNNIPIDHTGAMEIAKQIKKMPMFKFPHPVEVFMDFINKQSQPHLTEAAGGRVDNAGSMSPLNYEDARNFITAMGDHIDWDQFGGPGGRANQLTMAMRNALQKDVVSALKMRDPAAARQYLQANADHAKVMEWAKRSGKMGRIAGKVAGYGAGTAVGHPYAAGIVGGELGKKAATAAVKKAAGAQ